MDGSKLVQNISNIRLYLITAGLLLAYFILTYIFLLPVFESNDDVSYTMLASGYYTGKNEFRLIFINSLLGIFLSLLYKYINGFNWYSWMIVLAQFFSLYIIIIAVLKKRCDLFSILLVIAFLFGPVWYSIYFVNYTTTAILPAIAGLLLLQNSKRISVIFISALLISFGLLLRWQPLITLFVFYFTYMIFNSYSANYWPLLKRFVSIIVLTIILISVNHSSFQNRQWVEYNDLRKYIVGIDSPFFSKDHLSAKDLKTIGWCRNDHELLSNFFLADTEVANMNSLKRYHEIASQQDRDRSLGKINPDQIIAWFSPFTLALHIIVILSFILPLYRDFKLFSVLVWLIGVILLYYQINFVPRARGITTIYIIITFLSLLQVEKYEYQKNILEKIFIFGLFFYISKYLSDFFWDFRFKLQKEKPVD
jgi:hypothetical protein